MVMYGMWKGDKGGLNLKVDLKNAKKIKSYPGLTLDMAEKELPIIELELMPGKKYGMLALIGDFHIGSDGFSETQLKAYIDWIKRNPKLKVILMGDQLEVGDLSSYLEAQQESFKAQVKRCVELLEPIKNQIICILEGNHEERYAREVRNAIHLSRYIALELGIQNKVLLPGPQRGQLLVLRVTDGQKTNDYPIYVIHGSTGAIYVTNTQLKRMAFTTKVPLIAHGHTHKIFHELYQYRSATEIDGKFYESIYQQHWLTTGCFTKYLGYAEQKSYPMTKIGAPFVRFYLHFNALEVVDDARAAYGIGTEEEF